MTSDGWADEVLVADLERAGTLLVQDGNHGANRPVGEEILVGVRGISHVRAADISDDGRIDFRGSQQLAASAYDRIKKGRAKGGDTLLCHKGTVGPVARVPDDAPSLLCSPQTTFWRSLDHGRIDPGYLYYLLRSPFFQAQLVRRMHESDMAPYVSLTAQRSLILRLPEISEQRRAAGVLEALDRKMEANIALQERLIGTADLLFAHVCDDARKQGVEAVAATELLHVNPSVPISKGANTPFLEMAGTAPWAVRPERLGARPFTGGCKFTRGDTLVAKITGCIEHGKGAFVDFVDGPSAGSTEFLVLRPKARLTPEAVFLLSRWEAVRSHLIQRMVGSSGRQRVPTDAFASLLLTAPAARAEWEEEAFVLRHAFARSRQAWEEQHRLRAIRDDLLPKLVSGAVRVSEGYLADGVAEPVTV